MLLSKCIFVVNINFVRHQTISALFREAVKLRLDRHGTAGFESLFSSPVKVEVDQLGLLPTPITS